MVVFNYRSHRASLASLLLLAVFALPCTSAAEPSQAIFAGGCFWCMEQPFDALDGVIETISGYTGGHVTKPTYKEVSSGKTGHTEAILITYDPEKVSYQQLLEVFWRNIDPLDDGGQFCDRGSQYRSEIFALNQEQDELARASKDKLDASGLLNRPVVTAISSASTFYPAEGYHQDYYQTNPVRYKYYKWNCGRQQRLDEIWKTDPQPPA